MQPDTDVVIVGGGPAGLMLANELGRRGVRAVLLDQDDGTAVYPQANATQARTMEHYRRLGFADAVRAEGLPPDYPTDIAYYTSFARYELARFRLPSAAAATDMVRRLAGSWSAAELPHRVSQMHVERILHRQAAALPGIELRFRHRVTAVADHGDHISAAAEGPAGPVTVTGRYLVGCDGPRSLVRQHLGIRYAGEAGVAREFLGGAMHAVHLRSPHVYDAFAGAPAWMNVNVNHRRRCFFIALDGRTEFVFHTQLKPDEDRDAVGETQARAMFAECMGRPVPFEILARTSWTAGFTLVAERLQSGRLFIAGDAAHLFTPTGGLGYNTAIEDAVNLGWKLAAVIHGWGGAGLLASYEAERHPAAVRNTAYARGFADSLGGFRADPTLEDETPAGAAARAAASAYFDRHGRREFDIPGITFGTRYDGSPIVVPDGSEPPPDRANEYRPTACPGGRAPHLWLADGAALYDRLGFEFTLLRLGGARNSRAFESAAARAGLPLAVVDLDSAEARDLYAADYVLIRPDQTVAWRGNATDAAAAVLDTVRGAAGAAARPG